MVSGTHQSRPFVQRFQTSQQNITHNLIWFDLFDQITDFFKPVLKVACKRLLCFLCVSCQSPLNSLPFAFFHSEHFLQLLINILRLQSIFGLHVLFPFLEIYRKIGFNPIPHSVWKRYF